MLPLAFLIPFLASTAVKALVAGSPPDAGAWSSFTEKLLGVMVVEQSKTSYDLARIEAKLDQLSVQVAVQPYTTAMRSGGTLLEQAQRGWRSPRDRERLLHEARMQYVQAAAGAPDQAMVVDANVYLAMTWLLLGSVEDTRAILAEAALTLEQIVDAIVDPILARRSGPDNPMGSFVDYLFDSTRGPHDPFDQPELRVRMEQLRDLQDMRRLLGVAPAESSKPSRRLGKTIVWDPPRRGSSRHA